MKTLAQLFLTSGLGMIMGVLTGSEGWAVASFCVLLLLVVILP